MLVKINSRDRSLSNIVIFNVMFGLIIEVDIRDAHDIWYR